MPREKQRFPRKAWIRWTSAVLAAAVLFLSPGRGAYEALAEEVPGKGGSEAPVEALTNLSLPIVDAAVRVESNEIKGETPASLDAAESAENPDDSVLIGNDKAAAAPPNGETASVSDDPGQNGPDKALSPSGKPEVSGARKGVSPVAGIPAENSDLTEARTESGTLFGEGGSKRQIILVLDLKDRMLGLLPGKLRYWHLNRFLSKRLPGREIRYIEGGEHFLGDLMKEVEVKGDVEISHLIVQGHGGGLDSGKAGFEIIDTPHRIRSAKNSVQSKRLILAYNVVPVQVPEDEKGQEFFKTFNPTENGVAFNFFFSIRGKLAKGAKVLFNNCSLMEGSAPVIANKGKALAALLGLSEGDLYANRTPGWKMLTPNGRLAFLIGFPLALAALGTFAVSLPGGSFLDINWFLQFGMALAELIAGIFWSLALFTDRGYHFSFRWDGQEMSVKKTTKGAFWKTFLS